MKPIDILKIIRNETNEIILFHSLAGKDSIYLTDICTKIFDQVHCVYMYIIPGLEHMNRFKRYFLTVYSNVTFYEAEHFAIATDKQTGHLGRKKEAAKNNSLSKIMKLYREALCIDWIVLGSKQSDGLSRRLQLRTYEHDAIDWKNRKVYPLSKLKNADVYRYIKMNDLIEPLNYGDNKQSQSNDITDPFFLSWCKTNFPGDYQKIISIYPQCESILFRHENNT